MFVHFVKKDTVKYVKHNDFVKQEFTLPSIMYNYKLYFCCIKHFECHFFIIRKKGVVCVSFAIKVSCFV